jgi:hypothetical protein
MTLYDAIVEHLPGGFPHELSVCPHARVMPTFDAIEARGLNSAQVRKRWPRFKGECPDCGDRMIAYASFEHYMAGDW